MPLIVSGVAGMPQNRVHGSLAHVTDIVPTLLDLAQVAAPGGQYKGKAIEPIAGRSLLPVLKGESRDIRAASEVIGYELSGNQALFKGDLKLVKNIPGVGDGQWHLYDIRNDPGETRDLQQQMPGEFAAMQVAYTTWAKAHGVLPMPPGYDPAQQVATNTLFNYFIPHYRNAALVLLAGIAVSIAAIVAMVALRRRRRRAR